MRAHEICMRHTIALDYRRAAQQNHYVQTNSLNHIHPPLRHDHHRNGFMDDHQASASWENALDWYLVLLGVPTALDSSGLVVGPQSLTRMSDDSGTGIASASITVQTVVFGFVLVVFCPCKYNLRYHTLCIMLISSHGATGWLPVFVQ